MSFSASRETGGGGQRARPAPSRDLPPPGPRAAPIGRPGSARRAHWPATVRSTRPPWRAHRRRAAEWPTGPRAARAARSGHGGCRAAGGRSALAAVRRPGRAASCLVLALLSWLRPPRPRCPLPGRSALRARPSAHRRRRAQRAPVGSLPGHAEAGARWVSRSGMSPGASIPRGGRGAPADGQTDGAPGHRPPGRPGRRSSGEAPRGGSPRLRGPKPGRLFARGSSGSSRGLWWAGGRFARGSVCRSSGFLKQPPELGPLPSLLVFPPRRKRPQPLVLSGALSWGGSTGGKARRRRWPERVPRDCPTSVDVD